MLPPDVLAQLPRFRDAAPGVVATLARHAVERTFVGGEVIFLAGAEAGGLYVVLDGRVRVVRGRGDRQHVVHWEGPGGTLGDVPLFAGGAYPATAIAAEPTRCAVLSRDALHAAIAGEPQVAFFLLERLATRVRHLVTRLDALALRSATARLAGYLLERPPDRTGTGVSLGMTQGELAEELGTVREVVVRGLRALQRRAAVRPLGGGRFEIVSRDALRAIADEWGPEARTATATRAPASRPAPRAAPDPAVAHGPPRALDGPTAQWCAPRAIIRWCGPWWSPCTSRP